MPLRTEGKTTWTPNPDEGWKATGEVTDAEATQTSRMFKSVLTIGLIANARTE